AMIAGLPKAPSRANPISNPQAAIERRNYVLARMLKLGFIDAAAHAAASAAPNTAEWHGQAVESEASHIAEMVREVMTTEYGELAYTAGYRVITTLDARLQDAATRAVRDALIDYDRRHGWRGVEGHVELAAGAREDDLRGALSGYSVQGGLTPALVLAVAAQSIEVFTRAEGRLTVPWEGIKWAREHRGADALGAPPKTAADVAAPGDIVRIAYRAPTAEGAKNGPADADPASGYWQLAQLPAVEGALVSVDTDNGAVRALVGGFDYTRSKFNRVTQARRQPGSNFKPFIYSAALEKGFTAASFINDAPIVFDAPGLESAWRPENYSGNYYGPTRLREALTKSRNLVS
ncbi:MAG: penicillin-binding transpeptidase domain-containing protein, partial [Gammaproteobacteria bacterium]